MTTVMRRLSVLVDVEYASGLKYQFLDHQHSENF